MEIRLYLADIFETYVSGFRLPSLGSLDFDWVDTQLPERILQTLLSPQRQIP